jgi:hypothetical protein
MVFDGTTQSIRSSGEAAALAAMSITDPPSHVFAVVKYDVADRNGCVLFFGREGSSNDNDWFGQLDTASGVFIHRRRRAANADAVSTGAPSTTPMIEEWTSNGTLAAHRVNGAAADPAAAAISTVAVNAFDVVALGIRRIGVPDLFHDGNISALLFSSAPKDASARSRVMAHLSARWGISAV